MIRLIGYAFWHTGRGIELTLHPGCATSPTEAAAPRGADLLSDGVLHAAAVLLAGLMPAARAATGVLIGTGGCLEADRAFDRTRREAGGRYASPGAFSRTLPSAAATEIGVRLGLRGPTNVVLAGGASALLALVRAAQWMEPLGLTHCLAGGLDSCETGLPDQNGHSAALCLLSRGDEPALAHILDPRLAGVPANGAITPESASVSVLLDALRRRQADPILAASAGITASARLHWAGDQ